ncbi:MAG: hypothetical protein ABIY48_02610 [Acidimicrobiales bacterium]
MTMYSQAEAPARPWTAEVAVEHTRVIALAGLTVGVLVGGVGSRLAMLLLRVTSADSVHGLISDDGFFIGRVTIGGSYNLLLLGAMFGVIGAAAYGLVAPWLIGPTWFQDLTASLGAGAVVGGMLIHATGVDFTVLTPHALAVALFIAIPALFGALIGPARRRFARPHTWAAAGRRRWLVPLLAAACFPPSLIVIAMVFLVLLAWTPGREARLSERVHAKVAARTAVQGAWLLVAVLGLAALVDDLQAIL